MSAGEKKPVRTLGFIGTGNMGGALARAAAKNPDNRLLLANRSPEKAQALAREIGGEAVDNATAAKADYIFLGVKPNMVAHVLNKLREELITRKPAPVIVSMAAGISIHDIREALFVANPPIIRIMPNTPAAIGKGVTLYTCSESVSDEAEAGLLDAMAAAGRFLRTEDRLIDAGACISGCGPAFVDLFVEALADGGVACGLPRVLAMELAAAMTAGSAELILQSGKHPGQLKDEVCSPGGTTIRGVRALEEGGFRAAVMNAVIAAFEKK